jgi:ubiquinone/menaquinone biosynthesis C-methylase UbiE
MADLNEAASGGEHEIRERVRGRYAEAARGLAEMPRSSCCSSGGTCSDGESGKSVFGADLYAGEEAGGEAISASLGCGVPTAVADLKPGETVLDLGSGAGADVLISAGRVAPGGRAIGLDMTDEMLELARLNASEAGVENVEFLKGYMEEIPLEDASVDVVISNCVINLAANKQRVLSEAARVLKPGGRFAVSDVIADADVDGASRGNTADYAGCIVGALTEAEFREKLASAGLADVEVIPSHRVTEHAFSAIVRARKPD